MASSGKPHEVWMKLFLWNKLTHLLQTWIYFKSCVAVLQCSTMLARLQKWSTSIQTWTFWRLLPPQHWDIKQTSASSKTECTVSRCNTRRRRLLSSPSASRLVLCGGATRPGPAAPVTPSTWTRWAAHPAACPRNCLGLRGNASLSLKSFRWPQQNRQRGLWVTKKKRKHSPL